MKYIDDVAIKAIKVDVPGRGYIRFVAQEGREKTIRVRLLELTQGIAAVEVWQRPGGVSVYPFGGACELELGSSLPAAPADGDVSLPPPPVAAMPIAASATMHSRSEEEVDDDLVEEEPAPSAAEIEDVSLPAPKMAPPPPRRTKKR